MLKRPTSVSVVCWIIVAAGGTTLVSIIPVLTNPMHQEIFTKLMSQSPIPVPLQYLMFFVVPLISMVSGITMLRGRNWGRLLYVAWGLFNWIIGFATSPMKIGMIPGLVLFTASAVILFQPKANQYFSAGSRQNGVWQIFMFRELTLRKVINLICYIVAGLLFSVACHLAFVKVEPTPLKFVLIGVYTCLALFFLFLALWLTGFRKWQYYTGIVLLSVAGLETFLMFSRIWSVAPSEVEAYLPPGTIDLFTDYFAGSVCILVLCFAGILLVISGRKVGLDERSDQSWVQGKEATGFRSTGNGWNARKNPQSEPVPQGEDYLSVRGVSILEFRPESTAKKAGMHKGDVIIEYASERDVTIEKLSAVMAKKRPEEGQVSVVFVRDGQQYSQTLPSGPLGISAMDATINVPRKAE